VLFLLIAALFAAQKQNDIGPIVNALRSGAYRQAEQLADSELKKRPADPRLWTLNGMALERLGQSASAFESYKKALHIAPDYLPALKAASQMKYAEGSQDAVPLLERLSRLSASDELPHGMLAELAYKRGDCKTAVVEYQASRSLLPAQIHSLEKFGACLVALKNIQEATAVFEQIRSLAPDNPNARYNLAVVELMAANPSAAIQSLAAGAPPDLNTDSLNLLADAYEQTGDTPKAVAALRQAILQDPDDIRNYIDFANISLVHSSYQVGVEMLNVALRRLPKAAQLYVARGILYVQMGQYEEGDRDFRAAELLDPQAQAAAAARGMAELQSSHLSESESGIRRRLAKNPNDAFLLCLLIEVLLRRGAAPGNPDFAEALRLARKAVAIQPDLALAHDALGRLYLAVGRTADAIAQSRLAVTKDPSDETALYHLIFALRKGGQTAELPALVKRLKDLRQQAEEKDRAERRFHLVQPKPATPAGDFSATGNLMK
jgi:tetratricopeptide (TPR) repeat protein